MKKTSATTSLNQNTQAYGWKFWLWLVTVLSVVFFIAIIVAAWSVLQVTVNGGLRFSENQAQIVMAIAEFPRLVRDAVYEIRSEIGSEPLSLLMDREATEQAGWIHHFPEPADTGFLLFSGVDPVAKHSIAQLIKIEDGVVMATWNPDWAAINAKISDKKYARKGSLSHLFMAHPVLLSGGDIIFSTGSAQVRMNSCDTKPIWVLDELMHHSTELDETGKAIWAPSVSVDGLADNPSLQKKIRDDALARSSIDGRLLERRSFSGILRKNGLEAMLLGTAGFHINDDPIHINQIRVAHQDSRYWQRGDLLISARHLSTLFLYRPSTDKIVWYQTGPWMNQHSVDFVDDHRISVFNNNVVSGPATGKQMFMKLGDSNQVMVYDFDTKLVSQPFAALLAESKPVTITAGQARLLPDGGLFIEETEKGRHLRFTKDKLLWSRVNDYDKNRIGIVSWSRYLTAEEARVPLQALASRQCQAEK